LRVKIEEGFSDVEIVIKCPENTDEIKKIAAMLQSREKKLTGVKDGQTFLIDKQDVLYFESVDKRCYLYTAQDVYETPLRLYEIEETLTNEGFFRCSKSYLSIKAIGPPPISIAKKPYYTQGQ